MMVKMKSDGLLIVISGPSGVGKGTVCTKLLVAETKLKLSVSDTTRKPREGEKNGINYSFITKEQFLANMKNNAYLEWAEVYGNFYGTPKAAVEDNITIGRDTLLEIDPQGALLVKEQYPDGIFIFIVPPNFETLEHRLRSRNTDAEETIRKRLHLFQEEIKQIPMYDYIVVNDDIEDTVKKVKAILDAEHLRFEHTSVYADLLAEVDKL